MASRENPSRVIARKFTEQVFEAVNSLGATEHRIVAAVSGGPDSVALLLALHTLRRKKELDLAAAHANHVLRGDQSDADERFVRGLCDRIKVPLVCRRLPVPLEASRRDEGIEATARNLRQQFFADAARELGAKFVATAHTADDQAETVLHRVIRGTGLAGLAGIPASRELAPGVKLIRPLLELRRADVLEYLAAIAQEFREDRSNQDLTFTRNRIRHELIPYLANRLNPQVVEALARLAGHAAEMQAAVASQVDQLARRVVIKRQPNEIVLRIPALRRAPRHFVQCLIRQLWTDQGWPLQEIGQADLERIADVVQGKLAAWDLPDRIRVRRSHDQIRFQKHVPQNKSNTCCPP